MTDTHIQRRTLPPLALCQGSRMPGTRGFTLARVRQTRSHRETDRQKDRQTLVHTQTHAHKHARTHRVKDERGFFRAKHKTNLSLSLTQIYKLPAFRGVLLRRRGRGGATVSDSRSGGPRRASPDPSTVLYGRVVFSRQQPKPFPPPGCYGASRPSSRCARCSH